MIAIVLGILKIIGILLLVILGLLLLVVFSVLFVPVRYRAQGSFYDHPKASASVSWFCRLISLKASCDGEAQMDLRILWFHPGGEKRGEEAGKSEQHELEFETDAAEKSVSEPEKQQMEQELAERVETTEIKTETRTAEQPQIAGQPRTAEKLKTAGQPEHADENQQHKTRRFGLSMLKERFSRFVMGLKEKLSRIRRNLRAFAKKIRNGKVQWETIRTFIQNEENKKAFHLAKKQILAMIRHILPRKMEGKLRFGFGDPYMTGEVLTWISPFYGLYGRQVQVIPDFLEPCLEGEVKLKGHIRLGTLLLQAFRLLQNKQIRLWIKKWRES